MIRCTTCGTINAGTDIFCGKCGGFLEWTGVAVDPNGEVQGAADDHVVTDQPPVLPTPTDVVVPSPQPTPPGAPPPPQVTAMNPAVGLPPPDGANASSPFGSYAPPPDLGAPSPAPGAPPSAQPPAPGWQIPPTGSQPPPSGPQQPTPDSPAPSSAQPPPAKPEAPPPPRYRFRAAPAPAGGTQSAPTPAPPAPPAKPVQQQEPPAVKPGAQPPARPPQAIPNDQPRSRQPTLQPPPPRPAPPPRQSLAAEPEIKPGDLICSRCGMGNSPEKSFCRRCGNSLAAATVAVAVKVPWYRRIFGGKSAQAVMVAGERPSNLGRKGRSAGWFLKRVLVIVLIVAIAAPIVAYFTVPSFKDQVNKLIGQGGQTVVIEQHPPNDAFDSKGNTYWLMDISSGKTTATVGVAQGPQAISKVTIVGGASGSDYAKYGRPSQVSVILPGSPPRTETFALKDVPTAQVFCISSPPSISQFEFRVDSSFSPTGGGTNLVAVTEVTTATGPCS